VAADFKKCRVQIFYNSERGIDNSTPSEFFWQGLDGTQILTHWMPLGYRAGLFLTDLDKSYKKLRKHSATNQILMLSGSGSTPTTTRVNRCDRRLE